MHELSKGSASPLVYLLTGYVENNKPVGKLTPVANRIGSMTDKTSNHGLQLKLPLPNPTNSDLPWGKTLPEADLKELAVELNGEYSTPSQKDLYKRLSEEGLTEDEVKQWLVEDATKNKVRPLGAFKSE